VLRAECMLLMIGFDKVERYQIGLVFPNGVNCGLS
jgi:hypothetical protein